MNRPEHWNAVYETKAETDVSWFESVPGESLRLLDAAGMNASTCLIDVGGGDSRLVDQLAAIARPGARRYIRVARVGSLPAPDPVGTHASVSVFSTPSSRVTAAVAPCLTGAAPCRQNDRVFRLAAVVLLLALPCAAMRAPLVHAHLDRGHATEHHDGRQIHAHASPHALAVEHTHDTRADAHALFEADEDQQTQALTTWLATEQQAQPSPAILATVGPLPVSPSTLIPFVLRRTPLHDPPDLRPHGSRAPPVIL